jgi:glycosyltransferase involved in cell wall biosynthesis
MVNHRLTSYSDWALACGLRGLQSTYKFERDASSLRENHKNRAMKILLCKSHFAGPVSGSDETLVAYATHLHNRGYRPTVVLLYPPSNTDQYYARLKHAGVEVITIVPYPLAHTVLREVRSLIFSFSRFIHLPSKPMRLSRNIWQRISQWVSLIYQKHCRAYFKRCAADLIHVLTPDPGAALMIRAGAAAGIPVLYQELGTPHYLPELEIHYQRFSKVLPLCSEVAALSPRLAQQWGEKFLSPHPVSILPLLIEDRLCAHTPPLPPPPAGITFGFAARLERGKGPMILVEAFARVRLKLGDASLKIAGVGPQRYAVKARARELSVLDACTLLGAYTAPEDRSAFMQGLDVFVLPTLAEGTPNSIIEAMSHGLPVIASAVGGIPDLITPETGILVPPGDAAALANAMTVLASNPELRARMGHKARARYEQLFSPQVVLPMLMDTYRRTAMRNSVRSAPPSPRPLTHPWTEAARSDFKVSPVLKGRNIIFLFGSLEFGGAERQALMLAKYLSEHEQARVEVWGLNNHGPVAAICEEYGLAWRIVPSPLIGSPLARIINLSKLARTLRSARPDILLPYTLIPNVVCGLVWKWAGARLCVWNQRDEGIAHLSSRLERWAARRTPQFISNSSQGARFLVDKLNVSPAKVRVINNGVDCLTPKMSRSMWRNYLELDDQCFVACMVANLHNNKDHKTLLLAWRRVVTALAASGRSAVLVLAGRYDDSHESLIALSDQLNINHSIRFTGHVSDIPGLLSAVDMSVFSSRSEGCPNGVLESMAAGLAVAGTNTEGIKEAVGPAGTQFLAPPGDAEALAGIILKLAGDPTLCSMIGAENRRRVRHKYDSIRMCQETISLLVSSFSEQARSERLPGNNM